MQYYFDTSILKIINDLQVKMKTIENIKYLLIPSDKSYPLIDNFIKAGIENVIAYHNETELENYLADLKKAGIGSREILVLKEFLGRYFQKCPGSPNVICCNYYLLNTCFNCLYNCTYCYLHNYLNSHGIQQFLNIENLYSEFIEFIDKSDKNKIYRIGTGEFTDSLMFDETTGIAKELIKLAAPHENIFLEFKTKSNNVDHLLAIPEKGNTLMAWSLNTEKNISMYEEDSASLNERLDAARKSAAAGYYIAFHFDPIIYYEEALADYREVIRKIFEYVPAEKILWISLGGFRSTPAFIEIMINMFPAERISSAELFPGPDNKLRYFKPFRKSIYEFFRDEINKYNKNTFIYMCMETADMWELVFDKNYKSSDDLENDLILHLKKINMNKA